jgi:hypothetical protein
LDFVRYCPRCRVDYRPEIVTCADCGGELVTQFEDEAPFAGPDAEIEGPLNPPDPPPGDYRSIYSSGRIGDLEPLVEALTARAIPFRIHVTTLAGGDVPRSRFDLSVREEERAEALREVAPFLAAEADPDALASVDRDFDAQRGYARCPACSTTLAQGATECTECGLGLKGESGSCSDCGGDVDPDAESCPHCGAPFER